MHRNQKFHGCKLLYLLLIFASLFSPVAAQSETAHVDVLTAKGPITPIISGYIARGIHAAEQDGAALLVIRLDTPGGSVQVMGDIVRAIDAARVPIVVYVWPSGGRAASAGTLITMAAPLAAMAPRTTIGAAHPVGNQGQDIAATESEKLVNDMVANIRAHTEHRGEKAVKWAESAVRQSKSLNAKDALELGVIDDIAPDLPSLLNDLDGREATIQGEAIVLHTAGAETRPIGMTAIESFLHAITDPSIAFILMTIGLNGLLFELASPGSYLPGIAGGISLLLALYAMGVLSVNFAGLLFIALAFILFVVDVKAATHGVLTIGGIISFSLGAMVLFNSPFNAVPTSLIVAVALSTGGFFAFAVGAAIRIRRRRPRTGREGLIGKVGHVIKPLAPNGYVFVNGERWAATTDGGGDMPAGQSIRVQAVEGFRLHVVPIEEQET